MKSLEPAALALVLFAGFPAIALSAQDDHFVSSNGSAAAHITATVNGGATLSTNWTFAAWIHPAAAGGRGAGQMPVAVVTSTGNPDVASESVEILLSEAGGTQRLELSRGSTFVGEPSTLPVPLNTWTHIAVTVSSTRQVKYYINGNLAGDFPTQYTARNVALGGSTGFIKFLGNSQGRHYTGGLNEVQIWKSALSASEVAEIHQGKIPAGDSTLLASWFRFDEGSGSTSANSDISPPSQPAASLAAGITWGTVPHAEFVVTTTADEDDIPIGAATSLREAVREAVATFGPATITFAPELDAASFVLNSALFIPGGGHLTIDGSAAGGGVTLKGNAGLSQSLFWFGPGASASVRNLTLSQAPDGAIFNQGSLDVQDTRFTFNSGSSSGVSSQGPLTITRCEFTNNSGTCLHTSFNGHVTISECLVSHSSAMTGAAFFNQGTTTVSDCRFVNNTAQTGGAVFNQGTLTIVRSTLADNQASFGGGGAIFNQGSITLRECLVAGNSSSGIGGGGGGIYSQGDLTLLNCTVHGNTAEPAGAIVASGSIFAITHCTITGNSSGVWDRLGHLVLTNSVIAENAGYDLADGVAGPGSFVGGNPLLGPLGDYGGPTLTRVPLPGSPLIDAGSPIPAITTDQRGFPRPVDGDGTGGPLPDIGAYESGTWASSYTIYSWETLPASATESQRAPDFDYDGDGQANEAEWRAQTRADDGSSTFVPEAETTEDSLLIQFFGAPGRLYLLLGSDSLDPDSWQEVDGIDPILGNGAPALFSIPLSGLERRFFQVLPTVP